MGMATMSEQQPAYDVAIIGSGIAGSTLAMILARHGVRVVVFEAKSHPRFAIGESMILETSEVMRATAEYFDVPELASFSSENYLDVIGTSHGVKRHFSFLHHSPGQAQDPARCLQAVIPKRPHGHELHLFRQDTDAYLTSLAIGYGAEVRQETPVKDIETDRNGVTIVTAGGERVAAQYVVDAGGYRSILAERYDLRHRDLDAHSRSLFTHMIDVPDFHDVHCSTQEYGIPFSLAEGTLHHIFRGGWMWVIPFNNHPRSTNPLCSVGLMLDPRIHPEVEGLSPEEEFNAFIAQYPSMAAHFRRAKAVRPWTRTGRIQYSSRRVVGERFSLLGHAVGFIDPLYSKGLYVTSMSVFVLAQLLLEAQRTGDYSIEHFRPLEEITLAYVRANDRLVANSYRSFANYKLWQVMSVQWLLGAYTEYVKLLSLRAQATDRRSYYDAVLGLRLVGGSFPEFAELEEKVYAEIENVDPLDEAAVDGAVARVREVYRGIDWMPLPFEAVLEGKTALPRAKLRPDLLDAQKGFMRTGAYRRHFFGDRSFLAVTTAFVRELMTYSSLGVRLRARQRSSFARLHGG
jgi:FADH2 O2-dependent halogenase